MKKREKRKTQKDKDIEIANYLLGVNDVAFEQNKKRMMDEHLEANRKFFGFMENESKKFNDDLNAKMNAIDMKYAQRQPNFNNTFSTVMLPMILANSMMNH